MREEFHQPNEFHSISEFHQREANQEFHAPSEEYYAPKEEGIIGQIGQSKPFKASLFRRMKKMLYAASVTVFVTVAAQAVYPDFVVFSDPFSVNQEENPLPEIPSEGNGSAPSSSEEDGTPNPPDSEQSSEIWTDCPNCEDGFVVCPVCNGDWEHCIVDVVDLDCEACENGIILRRERIYIYNGTPCKFCNDVGTFLNVNGEIEECGECRGYASRHQVGEKQVFEYYNGDYRVYAFDESEEYVEQTCPECGGSGVIREEIAVPCKDCSYGTVECPVCEGAGGFFEDAATRDE